MTNRGESEGRGAPRSVLVTGAAGYIGRLLVRALADAPGEALRIVGTDIVDPARAPMPEGVVYEKLDVRAPELEARLRAHQVDAVVHLAAIVTPGPTTTRELMYSVDVEGTNNVLRAAAAVGVRQVVVTSSGAAYGYHPENAAGLREEDPLRGNETFPYSHHKRLVEEMLARYRDEHPELGLLVFRVGTILGASVRNQITDLFEKRAVLGLRGVCTPFVFVWDGDVVGAIVHGLRTGRTGTFNLAGDGTVSLREIAARLGKPYVALPEQVVTSALGVLKRLGLSQYGPEQVGFLRYRPVLLNDKLKSDFGYQPRYTSREVFELYQRSH